MIEVKLNTIKLIKRLKWPKNMKMPRIILSNQIYFKTYKKMKKYHKKLLRRGLKKLRVRNIKMRSRRIKLERSKN